MVSMIKLSTNTFKGVANGKDEYTKRFFCNEIKYFE